MVLNGAKLDLNEILIEVRKLKRKTWGFLSGLVRAAQAMGLQSS